MGKYRLTITTGRHGLEADAWSVFPRLVPSGQSENSVTYACSNDEPIDEIRLAFLKTWKEEGDIIEYCLTENEEAIIRPYLSCSEAEVLSGFSSEYWRQQCWKNQIPGAYKSGKQWYIPRSVVENKRKNVIEISQPIKERCITYAKQIAIYRGYTNLVNGLQPVDGEDGMGLRHKHDHEWVELREAFANPTKGLLHQYHEAADIFYYANQLEVQTGESWIASDLSSLRNVYALDPELVQKCAEAKYAWRSAADGNKDEQYELALIEKIIG